MSAVRAACPECDHTLVCPDCDDTRPTAESLYAGCQVRTPFGRYEVVTKIGGSPYRIMVSTEQSPRPWHFWASSRVDMIRPLWPENVGEPEIRVVDGKYRDSPIYAYATNSARSRDEVVSSHGQLIVATGPAAPGDGWSVRHYPEPADDPVCIPFPSKAAARSEVRRLARGYARLFKVKVRMVD